MKTQRGIYRNKMVSGSFSGPPRQKRAKPDADRVRRALEAPYRTADGKYHDPRKSN